MLKIDYKRCLTCGGCVSVCPANALEIHGKLGVNEKCIRCGMCVRFCPVGALKLE